jgi:homogentisate 1,2-dioxygenase
MDALTYQSGFGNHFSSEAVPGALPVGQNSPQTPPFGLYAEQLSGTAFTAPRHENRRSWLYRLRPSAGHGPYAPYAQDKLKSGPFDAAAPTPNRLRWDPLEVPAAPTDFVDGLVTIGGNGDVATQAGMAAHLYLANRSMIEPGVPERRRRAADRAAAGRADLVTELGRADPARRDRGDPARRALPGRARRPGRAAMSARTTARRSSCRTWGRSARTAWPTAATSSPVAAFEDVERPTQVIQKFQGGLWAGTWDHSPLDVVAWHGNLAPYKYDLARFNTINTVSFDHPDPSIFTVLTAPSEIPGTANVDFVIFPPRWMVAEHTFRPPWFHRNVMSEFMGLVTAPTTPRPAASRRAGPACTTP